MAMHTELQKSIVPERVGGSLHSYHQTAAFGSLYYCVTEVVELVTGHTLPLLYCHKFSNTNQGQLTVRKVLVKQCWAEEKIFQKFGKFQDLLDTDVRTMKKVDPDFGYMVIKHICNKVLCMLSTNTRTKILLLPKYKFKICHSYGNDTVVIRHEIHKLGEFVSSIYNELNEEFKCNVTNFKQVSAVLNTTVKQVESCIEVRQALRSLRNDNTILLLLSAQQELRQQYNTLQVRGPFQFLTGEGQVLETIFAPLKTGTMDHGLSVLLKDLLTTTLVREDSHAAKVLLVGGAPGAGKTSLCYYLLRDWCHQAQKIGGLEHADLVLLVEWARVKDYASLNSFLLDSLLEQTRSKFPEQLCDVTSLLKYDVLVVIDGFSARQDKERAMLQEVFRLFSNSHILMTTEPEDLEYIESTFAARNNLPSVTVSLCRLSHCTLERFTKYACRMVSTGTEENQNTYRQFKEHHSTGLDRVVRYCREPTTALVYAALWRSNEPSPSTPSRLHRFILEGLYRRFIISCQDAPSKTYMKNESRSFHHLGEMAWKLLCRNSHRVPQDMATDFEVEELLPVFFTAIVDNTVAPSTFTYTFASLPQQLHLAAIFLARKLIRESSYVTCLEEFPSIWEKYPELLLYTVGELNHYRCAPMKMTAILRLTRFTTIKADDLEYWYLLQQEGCHNTVVTEYVTEIVASRHWCLDRTTVVPGLKLLAQTPVSVDSIVVDIDSYTNPEHIPELMEVLQEMAPSLQERVSLELYLWKHYLHRCGQPSNHLVRAFARWCTITKLTGEIGPETPEAAVFDPHSVSMMRVRVSSPPALRTLHSIISRLTKRCKSVHVTLALPEGCSPNKLESLECKNLHLTLEEVHEENMAWVINVVKTVAGRQPIVRLHINKCTLHERSMFSFFQFLRGWVTDKISLCPTHDIEETTQRRLLQVAGCTIRWL